MIRTWTNDDHPRYLPLLKRRRFASQAEARMPCFSYIEGWYNPIRLHSGLGYHSPLAYEAEGKVALNET